GGGRGLGGGAAGPDPPHYRGGPAGDFDDQPAGGGRLSAPGYRNTIHIVGRPPRGRAPAAPGAGGFVHRPAAGVLGHPARFGPSHGAGAQLDDGRGGQAGGHLGADGPPVLGHQRRRHRQRRRVLDGGGPEPGVGAPAGGGSPGGGGGRPPDGGRRHRHGGGRGRGQGVAGPVAGGEQPSDGGGSPAGGHHRRRGGLRRGASAVGRHQQGRLGLDGRSGPAAGPAPAAPGAAATLTKEGPV